MKITRWNSSDEFPRGQFVRLNRREATQLLCSLVLQLAARDPVEKEAHRVELRARDGEYLSVVVEEDGECLGVSVEDVTK